MLVADDDLNVVINFHRMGPGTSPPSLSGYLGMDLGINMGATQADWTNQIQCLAATMVASPYYYDASRYPSAAIYNPDGNTTLANAWLTYFAPNFCNTVVSGFGGYSYGRVNMVDHADSTKHLKWYNPTPYTYIPDGYAVNNMTGIAHMVDKDENVESGSRVGQDSVIYGRGIWNTTTNDFDYTFTTLAFPSAQSFISFDCKVATSLDGQTVWMSVLTDLAGATPLTDSTLFPVLRKSTDGGLTWSAPMWIQLSGPNGVAAVKNHYSQYFIDNNFPPGTTRDQIAYSAAFDHSLTVDKWGNPHIGVVISMAPGGYGYWTGNVDSVYAVYDIYSLDDGANWLGVCMGDLHTFQGSFAGAGGTQYVYNRTYVSKNNAGDKLFFTWNDTYQTGVTENINPDIYARGFDLISNMITSDELAANQPNCVTFLSDIYTEAYYQSASPIVFTDNAKYTIPLATQWWADPALDVTFKYISDFSYVDANFTIPTGNEPFPVGIDLKSNDIAYVNIYPNPVKDLATVTLTLKQNANVTVELTNLVGQQVLSLSKGNMSAGTQQFSLNASSLSSGAYFLTVKVDGQKFTKKMIVE
jgi:hypothetical protein